MLKYAFLVLSVVTVLFSGLSRAQEKPAPLALIYSGKGACAPCIRGAANAAWGAGLRILYVNDRLTDFSVFDDAAVWIQPGGTSSIAIQAMGPEYLQKIREFVQKGGGYVGFCAGAFLSTAVNGNMGLAGLGIVPGKSLPLFEDFSPEDHAYLLNMTWNETIHRSVYFNGGAYFDFTGVDDPNLKVLARYDDYDQKIAAVSTMYGKGRIAVSGAHPEELQSMKLLHFKFDRDGSDLDLAIDMVKSTIPQ